MDHADFIALSEAIELVQKVNLKIDSFLLTQVANPTETREISGIMEQEVMKACPVWLFSFLMN